MGALGVRAAVGGPGVFVATRPSLGPHPRPPEAVLCFLAFPRFDGSFELPGREQPRVCVAPTPQDALFSLLYRQLVSRVLCNTGLLCSTLMPALEEENPYLFLFHKKNFGNRSHFVALILRRKYKRGAADSLCTKRSPAASEARRWLLRPGTCGRRSVGLRATRVAVRPSCLAALPTRSSERPAEQ